MGDRDERVAYMEGCLKDKTMMENAAEAIPSLIGPGASAEVVQQAVKAEGSKNKDVFLASVRDMFNKDWRFLLPSIHVPILLIGGTEDLITPTYLLTEIRRLTSTSALVDIENANHFSNLDSPERFNSELSAHVRRSRSDFACKRQNLNLKNTTFEVDTTAHALMRILAQRGVEYFFSNSGTDFTPIIDALARYEGESDFNLKTVLVPHENTAIAMAHGYFLVSRKPQVVMAHVNVGTANMGLGIINASRSRIPMLVLSGKTPWYESDVSGCRTNFVQWGQDTFDQAAYFREFTKWDYELKGARNIDTVVDRAFAISMSHPCGPVYLTLPKEPLCEPINGSITISESPRQKPNAVPHCDQNQIAEAARLIFNAKNPLVITAELGRYQGGPEALVQFAYTYGVGVIEHGKRNFFNYPTDDDMHLGFSPSPYVEAADLIIAIETHVPWIPALSNVESPPTIIQIGVDPLCQNLPMRSFPVDMALAGHPATTLTALNAEIYNIFAEDLKSPHVRNSERLETIQSEHKRVFAKAADAALADANKSAITKNYLSYCLGQQIDEATLIFNEYNLEPSLVPRRLPGTWFENSIASGLGWSLGAALGGKLAAPEATVVVTLGDGTYIFNTPLSAHFVASSYNLPILIVVFNDSGWSTIQKSYKGSMPDGWAVKKDNFPLCGFDITVQFEKLAESVGCIGKVVDDPNKLDDVIKDCLHLVRTGSKHVLLNVICAKDC